MFRSGFTTLRRGAKVATKCSGKQQQQGLKRRAATEQGKRSSAAALGGAGLLTALGGASLVFADDEVLHPPHYNWTFEGPFSSFDHAALRRGLQVYTQICAACHSLELVAYRTLIDTVLSEQEVKFMASEVEFEDGPDDSGEMFERPGKPSDHFPSPYKNEEEGRMANAGAYPPDLSLMAKARHGGADYIFSLLLGYTDSPEGIQLREGLYYNAYFPGGAIGMPKQLEDGAVEYEDGTPSTETQMAADVTQFLCWAAEPEMEDRKKAGIKWLGALTLAALATGYYKRFRFSILKSRKISYAN